MRSVFGWSLPPGVTSRMIDEAAGVDQPCGVCAMDPADCCCPECPKCGEQGNPACYTINGDARHSLTLNKEQALSRQRAVIAVAKQRVVDEEQCLAAMEEGSCNEWTIDDTLDPWG
jgi:hypothetical protein